MEGVQGYPYFRTQNVHFPKRSIIRNKNRAYHRISNYSSGAFTSSSGESVNSCTNCDDSSTSDHEINPRIRVIHKNKHPAELGYSEVTIISSIEPIKDNEAFAKINCIKEKICTCIKHICSKLPDFIEPEEERDQISCNRKAYEFCNRFSRNHLYQIGLQLNDISRNTNYCLPYFKWKENFSMNKLVFIYQSILQSLNIFQKQMRVSWGLDKTVDKLFTLTNLTLETLKFEEINKLKLNDECGLKIQCEHLLSQLNHIKQDRDKWLIEEKRKNNPNIHQSSKSNDDILKLKQKNAANKLSMYKNSVFINSKPNFRRTSISRTSNYQRPSSEMLIKKPPLARWNCHSAGFRRYNFATPTTEVITIPSSHEKKTNLDDEQFTNAPFSAASNINPADIPKSDDEKRKNIQFVTLKYDKASEQIGEEEIEETPIKPSRRPEAKKNIYNRMLPEDEGSDSIVDMQIDALLKQMIEMELTDCLNSKN